MKTNDILLKFQSNNNKLETVLDKKKFSGDVKNLLLSMLYKISSSYNDYSNIKVNVENKNKYIENMIKIINSCAKIEIVKLGTEDGERFTKNGQICEIDAYQKTIKVFPTEKALLFALFKLNDTKMYLDEKYNLIRIALPELLNEGRDINNIEIIRDFNAWSWNTLPNEISNIDCNLIYQNLQMLLGFEFLDSWMRLENQKDIMKRLEEKLKSEYDSDIIDRILDLIYRLAIIICVQRNKSEKARLLDEKEWDEQELEKLGDKEKLVIDLTNTKKQKAKEIKKIDKILNDTNLLREEFERRNSKLSEYKKIFSVENLAATLKKERRKALNEIDECNKMLDAKQYVKRKGELEKNVSILREVKDNRNKEKYKIELQKLFIKCIESKIDKIEEIEQKKEIIQIFSVIRYYNFIVYDEERFVKDIEALQENLERLEEKTIDKLYELKAINPITKDLETDIKIIMPIFNTRIMNLEKACIQAINKERTIEINIYDGDILELTFELENSNGVNIKTKKKIKLFSK